MAAIDGRDELTKRLMSGGIGWMYWAGGLALIGLSLAVMTYAPATEAFPAESFGLLSFADWVNQGEQWLRENYRWFTRAISGAVGWALEHLENFLLLQPWPVVTLAIVLPALVYGGIRLALFCLIGVMFWGAVDMWDSAMETLALMVVAVVLSVFFGVLIGIALPRMTGSRRSSARCWT